MLKTWVILKTIFGGSCINRCHIILKTYRRDVGLMWSDGGGGSRGQKLEGQYLEDFGDPGAEHLDTLQCRDGRRKASTERKRDDDHRQTLPHVSVLPVPKIFIIAALLRALEAGTWRSWCYPITSLHALVGSTLGVRGQLEKCSTLQAYRALWDK